MKNYSCIVLGDINIDYVTDISKFSLKSIDNACINSKILSNVGGNGTFFAEAALEAGFDLVKLICSLGKDIAAETIKLHFSNNKIELINIPNNEETGKVIILYQPNDKRILIADRGANAKIFSSTYSKVSDFIHLPADLLYISGYSLLNDESNITLYSIIHEYKRSGAFSIIDAVPHEVFHTYNWNQYVNCCNGINGIVIELETVMGFMKQSSTIENTDDIAKFLLASFEFCLVRLNSLSDFLVADRTNRRIVRIFYQPRIASLRFTDRVIAQIILRYIKDPYDVFNNSDWIHEINKLIGGIV